MRKRFKLVLLICSSLVLSSCGGGSSSPDGSSNNVSKPITLSLTAPNSYPSSASPVAA